MIKSQVREIESEEAVLIIDDSVEEKPYTDESELISWHYDHCAGRLVKGINLLSALYYSRDVSLLIAFELVQKTVLTIDPKTGRDKWVSPQTKNEMARAMIARTKAKQIAFRYVLADLWFASAENMVFIKRKVGKDFVMPLKGNRRVALSEQDRNRGRWKSLSSLELPEGTIRTLYLEGVPFPLLVSRQAFKNEDGREGSLILASSDTDLTSSSIFTIYQKRWKVEEYHKSLKSNVALAKAPTKLPHTQQNHVFACLVAFVKLEAYRTSTCLNHFALKGKLYQAAMQSALKELFALKAALPNTFTTI